MHAGRARDLQPIARASRHLGPSAASMQYIASTFFSVIRENGDTPGDPAIRRVSSMSSSALPCNPVHISVREHGSPTNIFRLGSSTSRARSSARSIHRSMSRR